ncbi:MAG: hypothetical protein R3B40_03505 [Polyangiales bacterium]|nr:hypothetical protein [Myxococcales bacterium]MCB9661209.1 hypothetical protein [Sandaracinaceae bacterium]
MNRLTLLGTLGALVLAGCASSNPFTFAGGYQDRQFPVSVRPSDDGRLISRDWLVDGWQLNADERPVRRQYRVSRFGRRGGLALRHRVNAGRIAMDVLPLDIATRDQDLGGMARDAASGTSAASDKFQVGIRDIHVVGETPVALGGHAGHMVLLEGGSGDGAARGAFVFVRANYREERVRSWRVVPVLVMASYVNRGADFEAGLADFQTFLASIQLGPSVTGE